MAINQQILTIRDPGLRRAGEAQMIPLVMGTSASGSTTEIKTATKLSDLDQYGIGPLSRAAGYIIANGGGPVRCLRLPTDTAGAAGTVTQTGNGPAMTVTTATAKDRFSVRCEIMTGGALGTARMRYTLDRWQTPGIDPRWSETKLIPVGGVVALGDSGLSVTFAAGTHVVGTTHDFTTTAPEPIATDINSVATVALLTAYTPSWRFILLANSPATASEASTNASAVDSLLTSLRTAQKLRRAVVPCGIEADTAVLASTMVTTLASTRISPIHGDAHVEGTVRCSEGEANPYLPAAVVVAARIAANLVSTDPRRVASGPLPGVKAITHDEYARQTLDDSKIGTLRTYPGLPGFYVEKAHIKSSPGSDFRYFQHGAVMDLACETVLASQARYIGKGFRTVEGGILSEEDAGNMQDDVGGDLRATLLDPLNAEGTKGHVSRLEYQVLRENDVTADETIYSEVAIQPLAYPGIIRTTLGYTILGEEA